MVVTAPLNVYWWAPLRSPKLLKIEARDGFQAWARLALRTARPMLNFGDELSRLVVSYATNRPVRWSRARSADVIGIGSILELAIAGDARAVVWGTGLRGPLSDESRGRARQSMQFAAVRGALSRDQLGLPEGTPLGDPGLVISEMVADRPVHQRTGVIYIPHFRAWNSAAGRRTISAMRSSGLRIVEPTLPPIRLAERIATSEMTLTSSLHGLILSHALGVPAQLVDSGEGEPAFKYADYLSAMGTRHEVRRISDVTSAAARRELFERCEPVAPFLRAMSLTKARELVYALRTSLLDTPGVVE